MLQIYLKNGEKVEYNQGEYTDYKYDGKFFIVIKGNQWIGLFNLDVIYCVQYKEEVDNG